MPLRHRLAGGLRRWTAAAMICAGLGVLWLPAGAQQQPAPRVLVTEISGAIGVATSRHLAQAIERAQAERAEALVVQIDTPGGLVSATRELIKSMIASPVPIVAYVAPSGARAASAGTFLVYASHVAAMAPGTNMGAATPVEIGGVPGLPGQKPGDGDKGAPQQTTSQQKAINDVVALLRSLAQLRGRSAEFAEKAVREAATLTAKEALETGAIDIVGSSVSEVLAKTDGRKVAVAGGERTLATGNAVQIAFEPDLRTRLLGIVSNPNVAFLLLMIGFYGLVLEFWNPGTLVAGVIGGISLILALVALTVLPVNYGALALLLLGLVLMVAEAFTPGIGILGLGGLAAFVAGAYFLFEGADADIEIAVSLPLILGVGATTALLVFGVIGAAIRARKRPATTGAATLIGASARVVAWEDGQGRVQIQGETWAARGAVSPGPGDVVRVAGREGLTLIVEP